MENERWLSAKDAAPFWGVGECMFRRTAKKANLLTRKAKGRKGVEYALSSFPPDVQRRAKEAAAAESDLTGVTDAEADRKSTRLNSSHHSISYAVFCLK